MGRSVDDAVHERPHDEKNALAESAEHFGILFLFQSSLWSFYSKRYML